MVTNMNRYKLACFVILFLAQVVSAQAPEENAVDKEALTKAQEVLRKSSLRKEALDTPEAKSADGQVKSVTQGNDALHNQLYGLSADLLPFVIELSKEDPGFLNSLMENPNADVVKKFYEKMPADKRDRVRALAQKIEALQKGAKKP